MKSPIKMNNIAHTFLSRNYAIIFNNKSLSDLVIKCEDKEFYASKEILGLHSPVFKNMFANEMSESLTNEVVIKDESISSEDVYEMLRFLYFGYSDRIDDLKETLLYLAEEYQIKELKNICENYCILDLNYKNAIHYLIVFDRCKSINYKTKTLTYIAQNFHLVFQNSSPDFDRLKSENSELLTELYSCFANTIEMCHKNVIPKPKYFEYLVYNYYK